MRTSGQVRWDFVQSWLGKASQAILAKDASQCSDGKPSMQRYHTSGCRDGLFEDDVATTLTHAFETPGGQPQEVKQLFARAVSGGEPFFKRMPTFTGALSREDVLNADVFVEVRPVNALAVGDEAPVLPLL